MSSSPNAELGEQFFESVAGQGPQHERLDAARMIALPMAVAGHSREEVPERIGDELDLDDVKPILR